MKSPCLHYKSFITPSQSTGSLVSHLKKKIQVHWTTGTSAPCISLYKPICLPKPGLKYNIKRATKHYDKDALWWRHEKLHRLILQDYQKRINAYLLERNQIEADFFQRIYSTLSRKDQFNGKLSSDLNKITKQAFQLCENKIDEWINLVKKLSIDSKPGYFYRKRWKKLNSQDKLDLN
jgi:dipeptidase